MAKRDRKSALALIGKNIAKHGHHVYVISGGKTPRFAYTIGLSKTQGAELILAGACFYTVDETTQILNKVAAARAADPSLVDHDLGSLGTFSIRAVHASWSKLMMLGAFDYYQEKEIPALQVVPDKEHWTIDIPDLSRARDAVKQPVWRWLEDEWNFPAPADASAVTNLDALRGNRITEASRWEEDEWEVYAGAGPDVTEEEVRVVPLACLLGYDPTLSEVASLKVGKSLWREADEEEWHPWGE